MRFLKKEGDNSNHQNESEVFQMKCKLQKQHKKTQDNTNAMKLKAEIEDLIVKGNPIRAQALLDRYRKRYGEPILDIVVK